MANISNKKVSNEYTELLFAAFYSPTVQLEITSAIDPILDRRHFRLSGHLSTATLTHALASPIACYYSDTRVMRDIDMPYVYIVYGMPMCDAMLYLIMEARPDVYVTQGFYKIRDIEETYREIEQVGAGAFGYMYMLYVAEFSKRTKSMSLLL